MLPTGKQLRRSAQQLFGHRARRRRLQRFAHVGSRPADIAIERPAKENFLVAECGIEAGAIDAHGPRQLHQRLALVAFAPEDVQGAVFASADSSWITGETLVISGGVR